MSELARQILELAGERQDVSMRLLGNLWGDRYTENELVFGMAELLERGELVRSAPGRYRKAVPS